MTFSEAIREEYLVEEVWWWFFNDLAVDIMVLDRLKEKGLDKEITEYDYKITRPTFYGDGRIGPTLIIGYGTVVNGVILKRVFLKEPIEISKILI